MRVRVCLAANLWKINDLRFFLLRRNQQFSIIPNGGQRRLELSSLSRNQLLIRNGLSSTAGRDQAIKDCGTACFEPTVKAIRKFSQIPIQMLARYMRMSSPNPVLQPSNDTMNIRQDLHCPRTTRDGQRIEIEIPGQGPINRQTIRQHEGLLLDFLMEKAFCPPGG